MQRLYGLRLVFCLPFLVFALSLPHSCVIVTCPVCGTTAKKIRGIAFAECPKDGLLLNLNATERDYAPTYFDAEYKAQYGKSYLDDHEALRARNTIRLEKITPLMNAQSHPRVLEVGSAAGFFLGAMRERGHAVQGWEISPTMAKYAKSQSVETECQDFFDGVRKWQKKKMPPFDILALFYVLEHLKEQKTAWENFNLLVRPGGYLLLALPSYGGPTFRFNRLEWTKTHPSDHVVDYAPKTLTRIAPQFGFHAVSISSEGIHPQRFPGGANKLLSYVYRLALKHAPISDTIFAILKRENS